MSRLTRIRWRLEDRLYSLERSLRYQDDAKVLRGVLLGVLVLAALTAGGFAAARALARASGPPSRAAAHVVTIRQKVRLRSHGRIVTRWRVRKLIARAQTVLETQTLHTPNGIRVVTHPVTRYRVVYRKHLVKVRGKTRTVLQPLTDTQTVTKTNTELVTVTHQVTQAVTTTVVSTETETLPLTVTLPIPGHG